MKIIRKNNKKQMKLLKNMEKLMQNQDPGQSPRPESPHYINIININTNTNAWDPEVSQGYPRGIPEVSQKYSRGIPIGIPVSL